jgi:hypothetical protein
VSVFIADPIHRGWRISRPRAIQNGKRATSRRLLAGFPTFYRANQHARAASLLTA